MSKKKATKNAKVKAYAAPLPKPTFDLPCMNMSYDDVTKVHDSLKKFLGYLLHKTTILYKTQSGERLQASVGLQGYHFAALLIIDSGQSINQNQICTETGVDKATMVKTIDHLEQLGYVERVESKEDRRVKNLHITKKGKIALATAHKVRMECEKDFLSALSHEESELFKKMLLRLIENKSIT